MKVLSTIQNQPGSFCCWCPGCERMHSIYTKEIYHGSAIWKFNGDMEKPTFTPSLLVQYNKGESPRRCHSYIRNGNWEFLNDCTHNLKGKTVPMLDAED